MSQTTVNTKAEQAADHKVTAEDVITNYRKKVIITRPRCPERTDSDEIIVCAQDISAYRVPRDTTGRLATGDPPPWACRSEKKKPPGEYPEGEVGHMAFARRGTAINKRS